MSSIGSINKPSNGFLVAAIQMPVPIINSRADIDNQVKEIVRTLHATKAGYPGAELIIFPEYSTQGLNTSKWLTEEFLCDIVYDTVELPTVIIQKSPFHHGDFPIKSGTP